MDDVAAVAGVSRGTVSRVLNGGHNVSKPALDAVQRAIRKTGYVVNQHARSLVTQRSHSVAFVLSEPQERLFEDPNFHVLLRGCTQSLAEHDITLVHDHRRHPGGAPAGQPLRHLRARRRRAAGLHPPGQPAASSDLRSRGVPVVACGRPMGHERDLAYVAADDRDGARQMVQYLRSQRAPA